MEQADPKPEVVRIIHLPDQVEQYRKNLFILHDQIPEEKYCMQTADKINQCTKRNRMQQNATLSTLHSQWINLCKKVILTFAAVLAEGGA